jgi:hypothetical protein
MLRSFLPRRLLFTLILCLGTTQLPAQEPSMIPPPIPSVLPPDPPDPDTLPPPPQLEWAPLGPQGEEQEGGPPGVIFVPPPQPEPSIAAPLPPAVEAPLPEAPDPAELELAVPEIEIWRPEGELPQVPERNSSRLDPAYVTGTAVVALRVQFDPLAAGKKVWVKPGRGMTINPPNPILTVAPSGECIVGAQLAEGFTRGHLIFYCENVKTVLPVVRASLAVVEEKEEETGGGQ